MSARCLDCGRLTSASRCADCVRARDRVRSTRRNALRGGSGWRWGAIKGAVLDRDLHTCQACRAPCPHPRHHEVDHIIPLAAGGSNDLGNLRTLCTVCHRDKSRRDEKSRGVLL